MSRWQRIKFGEILNVYRKFAAMGCVTVSSVISVKRICIYFMPSSGQALNVQRCLKGFMRKFMNGRVLNIWYGIGLIKQKYIGRFYGRISWGFFRISRNNMIPISNSFLRDLWANGKKWLNFLRGYLNQTGISYSSLDCCLTDRHLYVNSVSGVQVVAPEVFFLFR